MSGPIDHLSSITLLILLFYKGNEDELKAVQDTGSISCSYGDIVTEANLTVESVSADFTMKLEDTKAKENTDAVFKCKINDDEAPVQWFINKQPVTPSDKFVISSDGVDHTFAIKDLKPGDDCEVSVVIGDISSSAHLTVDEIKADFVVPLQDKTVKEKSSVDFECTLNIPVTPEQVEWFIGGKKLEPDARHKMLVDGNVLKLIVSGVETADAGEVTVRIGDKSSTAKLAVEELDIEFTVPLKDQTVSEQSNVEFTCELNLDTDDVAWFLDDDKLSPSPTDGVGIMHEGHRHSLTLDDVSVDDTGLVKVTAKGKSSQAKLTVEDVPSDFAVPLNDVSVMEKATAEMVCQLTKDVNKDKVCWFIDEIELPESDRVSFLKDGMTHKLIIKDCCIDDEGTVTVQVGDKKTSASLFVQELPPEFVHPLQNQTINEGETALFECELNLEGTTVKWFHEGREVNEDQRYQVLIEGPIHKLVIKDAILPDAGEIMAKVESKSTTAVLTVTEIPVDFTAKISEVHTEEHKMATFCCEVNKDDVTVEWLKDGEVLTPSNKHVIQSDGRRHSLAIKDVDKADVAEYSVVVGDRSSQASLRLDDSFTELSTVHGMPPSSPPPPPLPKSAPPTSTTLHLDVEDADTDSRETAAIISITSKVVEINNHKVIVLEHSESPDFSVSLEGGEMTERFVTIQEKSEVVESTETEVSVQITHCERDSVMTVVDESQDVVQLDQSESMTICDYSYDFEHGIQSCSSMYDLVNGKSIFEEMNEQEKQRDGSQCDTEEMNKNTSISIKEENHQVKVSEDTVTEEIKPSMAETEIVGNMKSNHIVNLPQDITESKEDKESNSGAVLLTLTHNTENHSEIKRETVEKKPSPKVNVILMPLQPVKSFKNGAAIFVCEVISKRVKVKWFKGPEMLTGSNDKFTITVAGKMHSLTIHNVNSEDSGEYSVNCDGQISSAILETRMLSAPTIPGKTINELLKHWASSTRRNTLAFVSFSADGKKHCLSRKEVYQLASAFAYKLSIHGVTKGDIVCIALPNSLERIVCDMGILLAGATSMNGLVLRADGQDFIHSLILSKAKFVITDPNIKNHAWQFLKDKIQNISDGLVQHSSLPDLRQVIICQRNENNPDEDFLSQLRLCNGSIDVSVSPTDLATVMTTSGSTGYSKLVPFTHSNLCHFCLQVKAIEPLKEGDHFMNSAPLGWAGGYPQWYLGSGVTRYFLDMHNGPPTDMPKFVWNIITSEKIVYAFMPPMYSTAIFNNPTLWDNAGWKPKILCLAGQPVNRSHLNIIGKLCQAVDINYGMTECNLVSTHRINDPTSFENGCAGFPGYGVRVKVVNQDRQEVPKGQMGEILIQSPSLTPGYLNNDSSNETAFTPDGWLCTDDAGYVNPQTSKLQVEGRQSDCIMRGSYILYPSWLEESIRQIDKVKDVLIVPVPDKTLHNEICACVLTDIPLHREVAGNVKLRDVNEGAVTLSADPQPSTSSPSAVDHDNVENGIDETDSSAIYNSYLKKDTLLAGVLSNGSLNPQTDFEDIRKYGMKKSLNVAYNKTLVKSDFINVKDRPLIQDGTKPPEIDYQQWNSLLELEDEIRKYCCNSQLLHMNDSMRMEPRYYVFFNKFASTNTGKTSRKDVRKLALSALNRD